MPVFSMRENDTVDTRTKLTAETMEASQLDKSVVSPGTAINEITQSLDNGVSDNPFSDRITVIIQWITLSTLCQAVCLFGVGSNIVNMICFAKQGFQDPVNVSFFGNSICAIQTHALFPMSAGGLAMADVSSIITVMGSNLCFSPAFIAADLPFEPTEFQHLVSGMPHITFTRISSWITALITMERCLCIIAPIKVKGIVTPRRVATIIVAVFVIAIAGTAPLYVVNKLGWKFYPEKNKTLIGMLLMSNRESVETVCYIINNVCLSFGAFIVIIVCTIVLVVQLHSKAKWRKTSTASGQADSVFKRNQKVAKMVVIISTLFIACFSPLCIFFIAMSIEPGISVVGKYRNVLFIFAGLISFLESTNSSVNIFVYYDMSSRYRAILRQLFCLDNKG